MSRILALLALLCTVAPVTLASSISGQCACTGTPASCSTFNSQCQSSSGLTSPVSSCTAGVANPVCSGSYSGSCSDSTLSAEQCSLLCLAGVGISSVGTWTCTTSSSSSCFPANATVELEGGVRKRMSALEIGDKVRVSSNTFSDVYMFSHRLAATRAAFIRITTTGTHTLMLTPNHYLYVNGNLAIAQTVKAGDKVQSSDGSALTVTSVGIAWAEGLYNPHTMDGDIVVDGVLTSTYTSDISPSLAHAALWPVRMLHNLGQDVVGHAFDSGSELLASVLPDGKARY